MSETRDWVIRKSGYFYRPNRSGYTSEISAAGRYTEAEAKAEARIEPERMSAHPASEFASADPRDAEISRLTARIEELEKALKPFSDVADTWTVQAAMLRGDDLLSVSNGKRMFGIATRAFIEARSTLLASDRNGEK